MLEDFDVVVWFVGDLKGVFGGVNVDWKWFMGFVMWY